MKKKLINIFKTIVFLSLLLIFVAVLGNLFVTKRIYSYNQGEMHTIKGMEKLKKDTIDVLFVGDSSMLKAVSPMELYEKTGIPSYNYGSSSARIYMNYYYLKNALEYQTPKVVFLAPTTFFYGSKATEEHQRLPFDYMKMNNIKWESMNDKTFEYTFEDKVSFFFPILRYHSRWSDMKKEDFKSLKNPFNPTFKGQLLTSRFLPNKTGYKYMEQNNREVKILEGQEVYLKKIVDLCKEKKIDLIFLGLPDIKAWNYEASEFMKKYAKETNTKFLDLNDQKIYKVDWSKDTEDGGLHMNAVGAERITKFLSEYIKENYKFKDRRKNKAYASWNKDLAIYRKEKKKLVDQLEKKYKLKEKHESKKNK